jgi:hypothetical protein
MVLGADRVRAQLVEQRGGAVVVFDSRGHRTGGARLLSAKAPNPQRMLDFMAEVREQSTPVVKGRGRKKKPAEATSSPEDLRTRRESTTLDRLHAAMLLQSSGASNALRALIENEIARGPDFLRLANALSTLYPRDSEENRLLDAMLLAVPR